MSCHLRLCTGLDLVGMVFQKGNLWCNASRKKNHCCVVRTCLLERDEKNPEKLFFPLFPPPASYPLCEMCQPFLLIYFQHRQLIHPPTSTSWVSASLFFLLVAPVKLEKLFQMKTCVCDVYGIKAQVLNLSFSVGVTVF